MYTCETLRCKSDRFAMREGLHLLWYLRRTNTTHNHAYYFWSADDSCDLAYDVLPRTLSRAILLRTYAYIDSRLFFITIGSTCATSIPEMVCLVKWISELEDKRKRNNGDLIEKFSRLAMLFFIMHISISNRNKNHRKFFHTAHMQTHRRHFTYRYKIYFLDLEDMLVLEFLHLTYKEMHEFCHTF